MKPSIDSTLDSLPPNRSSMASVERRGMTGKGAGEEDFAERVALWRQFRALFLKDLTLQLRAVTTNVCQLLTPIIFICFAGIMQLIINNILNNPPHPIPGSNAFPIPNNPGQLIACFKNDTTDNPDQCHDNVFNIFVEIPNWRYDISLIPSFGSKTVPHLDITYEELLDILYSDSVVPCHDTLFDLPFYYIGMSEGVDLELGNLTANDTQEEVNRTGFLGGTVPESWYYNFSLDFNISWPLRKPPNDTCEEEEEVFMNITDGNITYGNLHVPFFWRVSNRTELNNILVDVVKNYNVYASTSSFGSAQYNRAYSVSPQSQKQYEDVMHFIQHKNFSQVRPQGGVIIDQFNSSEDSISLTYTMVADKLVLYSSGGYHIPNNESNHSSLTNEIHRRNGIINMMSNALFKHLAGNEAGADVVIATYIMPLPSNVMNITIDVTTILGGILFPFAFSFVMPVFIAMLVKDRYEKHLIMMEQNGLSRWTYWLVKYCFNFIFYAIIAVVVSVFAFAFQIRLFTQTNALVLIVTLFLWGHAQVVLGFFFSNFFSQPRTGIIIGYLLVIAGVVVALLLEFLQVFPSDETPFAVYMMYPPFAFYRILFYLSFSCFSMQCYGIDTLSPTNGLNLVTTAMLYLAGSTLVLILVSIYLSYVLPGEYGVRKSPFFPLIALFRVLRYPFLKSGCYHKLRRERRELSPV